MPDGPFLLVANHSAGAIWEIFLLLREWQRRFGDRPARGLMHRIAFQAPFKWFPVGERIGGLYAHPEVARRALGRGTALLVFPGGDVEACRAFADRYRIVDAGRRGYVALARAAGVPIVPAVLCGAHAAYFMLPGTRAIARWSGFSRLFGLRAYPFTLGAALSLATLAATVVHPALWPFALAAFVQSVVPLPSQVSLEILPPVQVQDHEDDEAVAARVRAQMQETLRRMAAQRHNPWG